MFEFHSTKVDHVLFIAIIFVKAGVDLFPYPVIFVPCDIA